VVISSLRSRDQVVISSLRSRDPMVGR